MRRYVNSDKINMNGMWRYTRNNDIIINLCLTSVMLLCLPGLYIRETVEISFEMSYFLFSNILKYIFIAMS